MPHQVFRGKNQKVTVTVKNKRWILATNGTIWDFAFFEFGWW